jgi:hypothetical protein
MRLAIFPIEIIERKKERMGEKEVIFLFLFVLFLHSCYQKIIFFLLNDFVNHFL